MGHRLKVGSSFSQPNLCVPEPGRYTPKMESSSIKRTAPSFKIGNAQRSINVKSMKTLFPAPNCYTIKSPIWDRKSGFYIGKLLTYDDKTKFIQSIPGPGAHEGSSSMCNLKKPPMYSMGIKLK